MFVLNITINIKVIFAQDFAAERHMYVDVFRNLPKKLLQKVKTINQMTEGM